MVDETQTPHQPEEWAQTVRGVPDALAAQARQRLPVVRQVREQVFDQIKGVHLLPGDEIRAREVGPGRLVGMNPIGGEGLGDERDVCREAGLEAQIVIHVAGRDEGPEHAGPLGGRAPDDAAGRSDVAAAQESVEFRRARSQGALPQRRQAIPAAASGIDVAMPAVGEADVRTGVQERGHALEKGRLAQVVVVGDVDVLAAGQLEGLLGRRSLPDVGGVAQGEDAAVRPGQPVEALKGVVGRVVVDHDPFEITEGLLKNRLDPRPQETRPVVQRRDDGDFRHGPAARATRQPRRSPRCHAATAMSIRAARGRTGGCRMGRLLAAKAARSAPRGRKRPARGRPELPYCPRFTTRTRRFTSDGPLVGSSSSLSPLPRASRRVGLTCLVAR